MVPYAVVKRLPDTLPTECLGNSVRYLFLHFFNITIWYKKMPSLFHNRQLCMLFVHAYVEHGGRALL